MDNICSTWRFASEFSSGELLRYPWYRGTREKLNVEVLDIADLPSMYTLLRQRRLRWLCHIHRKKDGIIPKDLLYGEPAEGERPTGRSFLRFPDVCKRELKALDIDLDSGLEKQVPCQSLLEEYGRTQN